MSEEEAGDLGPGSGLVVQVHPYYCKTCQMAEMLRIYNNNFRIFCRGQKLCFQTNLKVHSLHLRFVEVLIWFVCTKVVFSLESKVAMSTFEMCCGSNKAWFQIFVLSFRFVCPKVMFLTKPKKLHSFSFNSYRWIYLLLI